MPPVPLPTCASQLGLLIGLQQERGKPGPAGHSVMPDSSLGLGSSWDSAVEKELLIFQGNFPGMLALAVIAQVGQADGSTFKRVCSY